MNLVICRTPLQSIIVEKILKMKEGQDFFLLYIVDYDNEKQRYYYNKLAKRVKDSQYVVLPESNANIGYLYKMFNCFKLYYLLKEKAYGFRSICFANINDVYIWFILSRVDFDSLETFDDGSSNLFYNGDYYREYEMTFIRKVFFCFLRLNFSIEKIKNVSEKHYTIYPGFKNIIENTYPIFLSKRQDVLCTSKMICDEVSIFLGQPLIFNSINHTKEIFDIVCRNIHIDYYFPHPREKELHKLGIRIIESQLIFEDYIIQMLLKYPYKKYNIYTFFSSAILNLSQIGNVNCNIIKVKDTVLDEYNELYQIYERMGMRVIIL